MVAAKMSKQLATLKAHTTCDHGFEQRPSQIGVGAGAKLDGVENEKKYFLKLRTSMSSVFDGSEQGVRKDGEVSQSHPLINKKQDLTNEEIKCRKYGIGTAKQIL